MAEGSDFPEARQILLICRTEVGQIFAVHSRKHGFDLLKCVLFENMEVGAVFVLCGREHDAGIEQQCELFFQIHGRNACLNGEGRDGHRLVVAENGDLCRQLAAEYLPDVDAGEVNGGFVYGKFDGFNGNGCVLHQIDLLEFFTAGAQIELDHPLGDGKRGGDVGHRHLIVVVRNENPAVEPRQAR